MKKAISALMMIFVMNTYADIEYSPAEESKATPEEVAQNRACFEELKVQGCGDPGDDVEHFKSCLKNVKPTLSSQCQNMMTELYGK